MFGIIDSDVDITIMLATHTHVRKKDFMKMNNVILSANLSIGWMIRLGFDIKRQDHDCTCT